MSDDNKGLKIKYFGEIITTLVTWVVGGTTKLSDFNVGSALRTLLEAFSLQIEEFYFDLQQNVEYAIENAIYSAFGFDKTPASNATGHVKIKFREALPATIIFNKGTTVTTDPASDAMVYFEVTEDTKADAGSLSVLLPVMCTVPGEIGNVPEGAIVTIIPSNVYVDSVTNETAFNTGKDEETSEERKLRFKEYIWSLHKGTAEAITYGIKSVSGVAGVWVEDLYIGYVKAYVHDANGELSQELKTAVEVELDNWRAAGIEVEVLPIVKVPVTIHLNVIFRANTDMVAYISNLKGLVTDYLNSFTVGEDLYISNLIAAIMESYKDVVVTIEILEGKDTVVLNNQLIVAGDITIEGTLLEDWGN